MALAWGKGVFGRGVSVGRGGAEFGAEWRGFGASSMSGGFVGGATARVEEM
jgi:hypothetical protein